eukprot:TRINITY_DN1351_c0_g1_i1.p1 TRINITY_DN1351_c0_g1~~TRINITY_DN1351_c0_g1_i1.p1  ORF type:complete len:321 (-),score=86.86 TRINITY_DN1351_c0_g1_i1:37-963(-)
MQAPKPEIAENPIVEVTVDNFMPEVLHFKGPLLLDCYADWCEPCKILTPILEGIVEEYGGQLKLAKLNVDEVPEISQQIGVQALPTVFGLAGGQMVDQMQGAPPEEQVREFVKNLCDTLGVEPMLNASTNILAQAKTLLDEGHIEEARNMFVNITETMEDFASIGLSGQLLCDLNDDPADVEGAEAFATRIANDYAHEMNKPEVAHALSALSLHKLTAGNPIPEMATLVKLVETDPSNPEHHFNLGVAETAEGHNDVALDHFLTSLKKDRKWGNGKAREAVLDLCKTLGPNHPTAQVAKKKLARILFI